jgi:putative protease
VGTVSEVTTRYIRLQTKVKLNNGDGLCFLNHKKELDGIHVNRVEGDLIFPLRIPEIKKGTRIYRNNDHEFEKILSKKTAERKISAQIRLSETNNGFELKMEDEDGFWTSIDYDVTKEIAQKDQTENIKNNLKKTGETIFSVESVDIRFSENLFIPASLLSQWRREITEKLLRIRLENYPREEVTHKLTSHPFPAKEITYLGNVANSKARSFYVQHQSSVIQPAFELEKQNNVPLMFTRHCVKHSMGWCPKDHQEKSPYKEPFFLIHENTKLRLEFDCKQCQMKVYKDEDASK